MSRFNEQKICWIRVGLFSACAMLGALVVSGCSSISKEETSLIAQALAVTEGSSVADVGAGDGVLLPHLAQWVGAEGRVYVTEIDSEKVLGLRQLASDLGVDQAVAVQGTGLETGLEAGCCDAIVTRMVYHHFTDPGPFIESLHRSLKPGGRLLIIDFKPSVWMSSSTPDDLPENREGQHGIAPPLVIKEVVEKGFAVKRTFENWPGPGGVLLDHFAVLFVRD